METITLQFQSNLKEAIMSFLETLPKKEIEVILENSQLDKEKQELLKQYNDCKKDDLNVYSFEEFEEIVKDPNFEHNKRVLHQRYEELNNGNEKTYTIEEFEQMLLNDES